MRLNFQLELRSDYHVGAGHGLGSQVDSALLRDADGAPVVRGTTLQGLLRDGLYRLLQTAALEGRRSCEASGLTGAEKWCASNPCPVCEVFGSPRRAKPWVVSSARPAGADKPLRKGEHGRPGESTAQVRARVRVSPRLRRAEPGKLFQQEEGDGRLRFWFCVDCPAEEARAREQAGWLVAAARMVRRLGSARRRGRGDCLVHLDSIEGWPDLAGEGTWQDRVLDYWRRCVEDETKPSASQRRAWSSPEAAGGEAQRFRLVVRLDEPVVLARRAEAGNLYESAEVIPGAAVLGALAQEAVSRFDLSETGTYSDFLDVFRRGMSGFHRFILPTSSRRPSTRAFRRLWTCSCAKSRARWSGGITRLQPAMRLRMRFRKSARNARKRDAKAYRWCGRAASRRCGNEPRSSTRSGGKRCTRRSTHEPNGWPRIGCTGTWPWTAGST